MECCLPVNMKNVIFAFMDREEINSEIHKIIDKLPDEMFEDLDVATDNQEKHKTKLLRFSHSLNKILREDKKVFKKLIK